MVLYDRYYREPPDRNPGVGTSSNPPGATTTADSASRRSTSSRQPIGVPEDYTTIATRHEPLTTADAAARRARAGMGEGTVYQRRPSYYDGDEVLPANYSPSEIVRIQQILHGVGMLGSYQRGIWDPDTMAAYKELLSYANRRGISADKALIELQQNAEATGTYGRGGKGHFDPVTGEWVVDDESASQRAPLVIRQTDPMYLEQVFDQAVIKTLGVGVSRDQIKQMAAAYNAMEAQRQQEAYDMEMTGGTVLDIPSPESWSTNFAEQTSPEKAQLSKYVNTMQDTLPLLSDTAWGV